MGIGTLLETSIDQMTNTYLTTASAAVSAMVAPVALVGVTIYIILIGYATMRGEAHDGLHTNLWKAAKIAIYAGVAVGAGVFQGNIIGALDGILTGLINALGGQNTIGATIDVQWDHFNDLLHKIDLQAAQATFIPNLTLTMASVIVVIAMLVFFGIALVIVFLAKVAFAMIAALGPAFIICGLFPATRRWLENWVSQALNFIILQVLAVSLIAMLSSFVGSFANNIVAAYGNDADLIGNVTELLLACIALGVIMLYLPTLANGLAGGASFGVPGLALGPRMGWNGSSVQSNTVVKRSGSVPSTRGRQSGRAAGPSPLYRRQTLSNIQRSR